MSSWFGDAGEWIEGLTGKATDAALALNKTQAEVEIARAQAQASQNAQIQSASASANNQKTVIYVGAAILVAALFLRQTRAA